MPILNWLGKGKVVNHLSYRFANVLSVEIDCLCSVADIIDSTPNKDENSN